MRCGSPQQCERAPSGGPDVSPSDKSALGLNCLARSSGHQMLRKKNIVRKKAHTMRLQLCKVAVRGSKGKSNLTDARTVKKEEGLWQRRIHMDSQKVKGLDTGYHGDVLEPWDM
ncbi:hypothetical protein NDU88_005291 [Pleurodeles waltl]|uniref:Uncharacterized protein n=1 Tax=Pleurodeles waltl TaxID=8319 RepID=A0AAV7MCE6_PLEWA|nr:hypothetical protein NDU88_005291 [Pleurodeles waltl]